MATAITMRLTLPRLLVLALLLVPATPAMAFSDAELIDGFKRTVFGSEYPSFGWQSNIVKKFAKPVRLFVDDRSRLRRGAEAARFAQSLPGLIDGLRVSLVSAPEQANFRVFVVDRKDYRKIVAREVYGRPTSTFAPGKCLVRVVAMPSGIARSDAVIVADEGDFLFRRCMVEEILQGLGPVNDDRTLSESIFNDASKHQTFTDFDRHLLNMLYSPLLRPGMSKSEAARVLPVVTAEVQARLR
jgi:Protein of unknown function (DUF2927)